MSVNPSNWSTASTRVTHIEIHRYPADLNVPGSTPIRHVGVGYQVVLASGRIIHEGGLTVHNQQQGHQLPPDLIAAVEALWQHADQQVAAREGLPPAAAGPAA